MISIEQLHKQMTDALNRLAKWRTVLAGWQLGTRPKGDPECDAVRDQQEGRLLMRAELSALTQALFKKGIIKKEDFFEALTEEAEALSVIYEKKFPGFKATDDGVSIDVKVAAQTTKGCKP